MIFLFFVIALLSLLVLVVTVGSRIEKIRRGHEYIYHPESIHHLILPRIDTLADGLVSGAERFLGFIYHEAVLRSHRFLSTVKSLVIKVEARFAHVVDSIHGRGHITKKGSASFFLREISGGK